MMHYVSGLRPKFWRQPGTMKTGNMKTPQDQPMPSKFPGHLKTCKDNEDAGKLKNLRATGCDEISIVDRTGKIGCEDR